MKKISNLIIALILISGFTFGQELKLKVNGLSDTTVYLIKYMGNTLYYADTAQLKNGVATFDGSKQESGVIGLLMPGQRYFEFIYNDKPVFIETEGDDFISNMKVHQSKENKVFLDYIRSMKKARTEAMSIQKQIKELGDSDQQKTKKLKHRIDELGDEILAYQKKAVAENPNTLVGKIISISTDVQIPEELSGVKSDADTTNDNLAYYYYRDHFWDNVDFTDNRLTRVPVLENKLDKYMSSSILPQNPDTLVKYMFKVVDQIPKGTFMYRFFVTKITAHFEEVKIMGMDEVWNKMIKRYYCSKDVDGNYNGFWMRDGKLDTLCEKTDVRLKLLIGEKPPNLLLPDSTGKFHNLFELDAEYTILYFWDPDCGHCQKITPLLEKLYSEKFKDRNVAVYAVGEASHSGTLKDWKKFIQTNKLTFINVGVTPELYKKAKDDPFSLINNPPYSKTENPQQLMLNSLNYKLNYDVFSTPTAFVLDKNHKIIAKKLNVPQIERFIDRLQGKEDAEKILELEEAERTP